MTIKAENAENVVPMFSKNCDFSSQQLGEEQTHGDTKSETNGKENHMWEL